MTVTVLGLWLAEATSALPSPFRSATATPCGNAPMGSGTFDPSRNAPPVFCRTETVLPVRLTVTTSWLPSWLKSPTVAVFGTGPVLTGGCKVKPPEPLPRYTAAWPTPLTRDNVTTRSVLPSLLISVATAARGPKPGDRILGEPNPPAGVPR